MSEEVAASIGDVLAENARLRKENMQLRHDVVTWRLIVSRQERRLEQMGTINRALNIQGIGLLARESQLHRAARRLLAAWRAEGRKTHEWRNRWFTVDARALLRDIFTARADGRTMDMHAGLDRLAELLNEA